MKFPSFLFAALLAFHATFSQPLKINQTQINAARSLEAKALATNDSVLLAHSYYRYGHTYSFAGDNGEAKRYYIKALKILENRPASYDLGHIYVRLCEVVSVTSESKQDLSYLYKAIAIFTKINSASGLAMAYGMLSGAYGWRTVSNMKEQSAAFDTLTKLNTLELHHAMAAKDTAFIVDAYVRLGGQYSSVHNADKSIQFLRKGLELANMTRNDTIRIRALIAFSDTYLADHKPDLARPYIEQVERIYKQNNFQQFFILRHYLQSWNHYYVEKGEWKKAFDQLFIVNSLLNSTDLASYDKTTSLMDREFEAQKTELFLKAQQKEKALTGQLIKIQRKFILIAITLLVITTVLSIFFFKLYRKFQRISREHTEISIKNQQLVREQSHRVKNNLQMVSSLLNMQARELLDIDARQAIMESKLRVQTMAIIQRKLYETLHLTSINLAEFIPELANDVLISCGFGTIAKSFDIDPLQLDVDRAIPIGLIITELIINASKYAFPGNPFPELNIVCTEQDEEINFLVRDNGIVEAAYDERGVGLAEKQILKAASFGTKLIQLLVQQLGGTHRYTHGASATEFVMRFSL